MSRIAEEIAARASRRSRPETRRAAAELVLEVDVVVLDVRRAQRRSTVKTSDALKLDSSKTGAPATSSDDGREAEEDVVVGRARD